MEAIFTEREELRERWHSPMLFVQITQLVDEAVVAHRPDRGVDVSQNVLTCDALELYGAARGQSRELGLW